MIELTMTRLSAAIFLALAVPGCFHEDFDPYLPYTTSSDTSGDTGSGTADTSTTGDTE